MTRRPVRRLLMVLAATAATFTVSVGLENAVNVVAATSAGATTNTCQQYATLPVDGGLYHVQTDEWNSTATQCIATDGNADFTVTQSDIDTGTNTPGSYPSIYRGCHWGDCTQSSGLPVEVKNLGDPTTSWSTVQPQSGRYDVAYDIWFNQSPTTSSQPNGAELMIWLNHTAGVQPAGTSLGSASIDGKNFTVWFTNSSGWNYVAYEMTSATTSVTNLDIGAIVRDAEARSYIAPTWYLIDVEAGFEIWSGGAGLATSSFSFSPTGVSKLPLPVRLPAGLF